MMRVLSPSRVLKAVCRLLAAGIVLILVSQATAGEWEQRDFGVQVDGKSAGTYQMTVVLQDDGNTVVTSVADVAVKAGPITLYSYSFRGTETWKDGRLVRLDSSTNDDGKRFTVNAIAEAAGLRTTVNGQQRINRADIWTTTYWRLADARWRNQTVPLLDADTGRPLQARLTHVGVDQITINGRAVPCGHFQLRGDVTVDLWYDGFERLVRQEAIDDGHKTTLEMKGYQRAKP